MASLLVPRAIVPLAFAFAERPIANAFVELVFDDWPMAIALVPEAMELLPEAIELAPEALELYPNAIDLTCRALAL